MQLSMHFGRGREKLDHLSSCRRISFRRDTTIDTDWVFFQLASPTIGSSQADKAGATRQQRGCYSTCVHAVHYKSLLRLEAQSPCQ